MTTQFYWFTVTETITSGWETRGHFSEESARSEANSIALTGVRCYVVKAVSLYERPRTAIVKNLDDK